MRLRFVLGEMNKMGVELTALGIGFEDRSSRGVPPIKDEDPGGGSDRDEDGVAREDSDAVPSMEREGQPEAFVSMACDDDDGMPMKEEGNPDEVVDDLMHMDGVGAEFIKQEKEKLLHSCTASHGRPVNASWPRTAPISRSCCARGS